MTDKLDPETEARIREACASGHGGGYCVCDRIRAAIKADREARGGVNAERAHADALAEALRPVERLPEWARRAHTIDIIVRKDAKETRFEAGWLKALFPLLAAHDKRRRG